MMATNKDNMEINDHALPLLDLHRYIETTTGSDKSRILENVETWHFKAWCRVYHCKMQQQNNRISDTYLVSGSSIWLACFWVAGSLLPVAGLVSSTPPFAAPGPLVCEIKSGMNTSPI